MKKESLNLTLNDIVELYNFDDVISILHKENLHIVSVIISQLEESLQKKVLHTFQIDKQSYLLDSLKRMSTVKDSVIETITKSYTIQLNNLIESKPKLSKDLLIELEYQESFKWISSLKVDQIQKIWQELSFNERRLVLKIQPNMLKAVIPIADITITKIYKVSSKIANPRKSKFIEITRRIKKIVGKYYG